MSVVIHWKLKNISILCTVVIVVLLTYKINPYPEFLDVLFGTAGDFTTCNAHLNWLEPISGRRMPKTEGSKYGKAPIIGIVGAPGSGVLWLRYIVEQMTGIYTGSALIEHPNNFQGEGLTQKVIAVMAYDADVLPQMKTAIMVYRNLFDTVRTHFAMKHGLGAFLEAPLNAYYGQEWTEFAEEQSNLWIQRYQGYLNNCQSVLVLSYDELDDPNRIQEQLLRISNFLRVPIKHSVLECLVDEATVYSWKPRPLRTGFQPFNLLPRHKVQQWKDLENVTEMAVQKTRASFRPMV